MTDASQANAAFTAGTVARQHGRKLSQFSTREGCVVPRFETVGQHSNIEFCRVLAGVCVIVLISCFLNPQRRVKMCWCVIVVGKGVRAAVPADVSVSGCRHATGSVVGRFLA